MNAVRVMPAVTFPSRSALLWKTRPLVLISGFLFLWLIANCRNGISSWEIHRSIGYVAMQDDLTGGNFSGEVEIDETFIGGKVRNMHKARKAKAQLHSQLCDKSIVLGALERASDSTSGFGGQ